MALVKLAELSGSINSIKVLKFQRRLVTDLDFRLLAVNHVITIHDKKKVGIDSMVSLRSKDKIDIVEELKRIICKTSLYKVPTASPLQKQEFKNVYMSTSLGKLKPLRLTMSNIIDSCLQSLINLVLEPLVELTSDKYSYGYRKYRNVKMSLGFVSCGTHFSSLSLQ